MDAMLKKDLDAIADVFAGADGGLSYINLRSMLEDMDNQAFHGDAGAHEVLNVVRRFRTLINTANKAASGDRSHED